jgi:hypothetical protein
MKFLFRVPAKSHTFRLGFYALTVERLEHLTVEDLLLLGEMTAGAESDGLLYRDQHGVVSVSLCG